MAPSLPAAMLYSLVPVWAICALVSAALLGRDDHAGQGFLWGLVLGPVGLLIVWRKRAAWERRWQSKAGASEDVRKEQAWREWRGY